MSYTPANIATSDLDFVRVLIGDTNATAEKLSNDEINGIIAREPHASTTGGPWLVAATCLELLAAKFSILTEGLAKKKVDELDLTFGLNGVAGLHKLAAKYRKLGRAKGHVLFKRIPLR